MADNRVDTPSVVERTRPIAPAGSGIVDAHFLGRTAAFVRASCSCRRRAKPGARRQRWTGKQIAAETHSRQPPLAEYCAGSA
jgi:hypothetical protein